MSKEKFTQGEWVSRKVERKDNWDEIVVHSPDYMAVICVCRGTKSSMVDWLASINHLEPNANLIAAAPDMYRALQVFIENSSCQTEFPNACEKAEQALAKARGES